jgi:hypothetical protein
VLAHHGDGPEACLYRDLFDGQVRRFEQPLGAMYACVREPRGRRCSHLLAKTTAESPQRSVSCATVAPMDRCRLVESRRLGYCASPLGQSDLAVDAEFRGGCMIFDSMIAMWFLAGAPSFLKRPHAAMRTTAA